MPEKSEAKQKPRSSVGSIRPRASKEQHIAVRSGITGPQSKQDQDSALPRHTAVTPLPSARDSAPISRQTRFAQDLSRVPARARPGPAVQRDNGEPAGGAAAEGVEVPGTAGASQVGFVGDILTALDTGLTLADIGLVGVAALETAGFMAFAGTVGVLGALAFIVVGLFMLADAWRSGEKVAAVQGASYAIVSIAHGRPPPPAPGWMGQAATFNSTARQVQRNLRSKVEAGGRERDRALGSLIAIRRAAPETILNQIYQRLVRENLQATFLGIDIGGGLYNMARRAYLGWPGVSVDHRQD